MREPPCPSLDRPPNHLLGRNQQCTYCNRLGHTIANCRTKWNCCYYCGSGDHYFRQCPKNRNEPQGFRTRSNSQVRPLQGNSNFHSSYNSNSHQNSNPRFLNNNQNGQQRYNNISNGNIRNRHNSDPGNHQTRPLNG